MLSATPFIPCIFDEHPFPTSRSPPSSSSPPPLPTAAPPPPPHYEEEEEEEEEYGDYSYGGKPTLKVGVVLPSLIFQQRTYQVKIIFWELQRKHILA